MCGWRYSETPADCRILTAFQLGVAGQQMEQISFEQRGNVGLVTLNRPDRLNAWTNQMNAELCDIITRCNADASIGALVVTGAGRGFCAGADIKDSFQARLEGKVSSQPSRTLPDWVTLVRASKPLVAAVN